MPSGKGEEVTLEMWFTQRPNQRRRVGSRRRAWQVLEAPTGEQPTQGTEGMYGPALPEESTVHFVLNLALRIGEIQMASGAGASDVTATMLAVTASYGLPHCEADVVFTSITIACHRGTDLAPVTSVRVVRTRGVDYSRLTSTEALVRKITRGKISSEDAYAELRRIEQAPHPYPRWVSTAAWGGMAASIAVLIGANGYIAMLAFVVAALIDRIGRLLNRRALPFFFQQTIGGTLATGIALAIMATDWLGQNQPSLVIGATITVLLSGLSVVGTVQDAISGYNVTAAGRSLEVALMTIGLVTGVLLALKIGNWLGSSYIAAADAPSATVLGVPLKVVAGASAAACFALASYSRLRGMLVSAAAGAVGAAAYSTLALTEVGQIAASAIAATLVGFCGGLMARRLGVTPLVVAVSGMVPLLPGLLTYRALYQIVQSGELATLAEAISVGLALGAGVVLGEYLAQPVRTGLGRLERRMAGPRMAGPLRPARRRLE
ncbi:MAG: threonine/serine exporter family protein [Pseudonocardiaceae bacterium]|nr:threonine/serine exporter family protein [Pseudonocardiaceae bacterium]